MLQWFRKQPESSSASKLNGNGNDLHIALMRKLVDFLEEQISSPKRATAVLSQISRFKELPPTYQEGELPGLYLKIEQYLCDDDPLQKFNRAMLRKTVKYRYEPLMELENFGLIFEPDVIQEVLLGQFFLRGVIEKARGKMADSEPPVLKSVADWVLDIPNVGHKEIPFEIQQKIPENISDWMPLLIQVSQKLYHFLHEALGDETAAVFDAAYRELAETYNLLNSFQSVVQMLPEQLLDESKLNLLTSEQVREVFLIKLRRLQQANEALQRQYAELQETRNDLSAAEETTLESVQLFNSVLNTVEEGIIATDEAGKIILMNQRVLDIFGYQEEDLVGKDFTVLLPEKYREQHQLGIEVVEKTGLARAFGERLSVEGLKKDQTVFPVELLFSKTVIADRTYFTVAVHDISLELKHESEFKKTLSNLRTAREQYRSLVDSLPDVVFSLSLDGSFTMLNPAFERMTGWDRDEWLGKPFTQIVHPNDSIEALRAFQQVLQEEEARLEPLRIRNSQDEYLEGTFSIKPQMQNGKLMGAFGIVQNLRPVNSASAMAKEPADEGDAAHSPTLAEQQTALASLEAALEEKRNRLEELENKFRMSEQRYFKLMTQSDAGMGIHANGRLVFINPAGARLLGAEEPAQLLDKSMVDLIQIDDRELFQEVIFRILKDGADSPLTELKMQRIDGSAVEVEYRGTPVIYDGAQAIQFIIREKPLFEIFEETPVDTAAASGDFARVFENLPDPVLINDLDGVILQANPAAARLFGCDTAELAGTDFLLRVPEAVRDAVSQNIYLQTHGRTGSGTAQVTAEEGSRKSVTVWARRMEWKNQPAVLVHLREQTPSPQAEEEMQFRISELAAALQKSRDRSADLERQLQSVRQQYEQARTALADLQANAAATRQNEEEHSHAKETLQAELNGTREKLAALAEELQQTREKLAETEQRLQESQKQTATLTTRLTEIREEQETAASRRGEEQTAAKALAEQLAEANDRAENAGREVISLQQRVEDLEGRLETVQMQYENAREKLQKTREDLEAKQETDRELQKRYSVVQAKLQNAQKRLDEVQSRHDEVHTRWEQLTRECEETKRKTDAAQTLHEDLQNQIAAARDERDQLEMQLAETRANIESAKNKLVSMEAEAQEKSGVVAAVRQELAEQTEKLNAVRTEYEELCARRDETNLVLESVTTQLRTAETVLMDLQSQLREREAERDALEQQLAENRASYESATIQLSELQGEVQEKSEALAVLQQQLAETQAEFETLQSQVAETSGRLDRSRREYSETSEMLSVLKEELAELNRRVEEKRSQRDTLDSQVAGARQKLEALRREQEQVEAAFNRRHGSMQELEQRLEELDARVRAEKTKVEKLSKMLPITANKEVRDDEEYWEAVWAFVEDPANREFFPDGGADEA